MAPWEDTLQSIQLNYWNEFDRVVQVFKQKLTELCIYFWHLALQSKTSQYCHTHRSVSTHIVLLEHINSPITFDVQYFYQIYSHITDLKVLNLVL